MLPLWSFPHHRLMQTYLAHILLIFLSVQMEINFVGKYFRSCWSFKFWIKEWRTLFRFTFSVNCCNIPLLLKGYLETAICSACHLRNIFLIADIIMGEVYEAFFHWQRTSNSCAWVQRVKHFGKMAVILNKKTLKDTSLRFCSGCYAWWCKVILNGL